jgi:hypothetical protein
MGGARAMSMSLLVGDWSVLGFSLHGRDWPHSHYN